MNRAGIAGDVIGIREVFLVAGVITGFGAVVALIGFRGVQAPDPAARDAVPSDALPVA